MSEQYQTHPLALEFPPMLEAEYQALKADIKANRQREPIIIHEGMILDGRHRYRAVQELNYLLKDRLFDEEKDGNPRAFVLSLNMHRRHLTTEQRQAITKAMLEKDASQSNAAVAAAVKLDPKTVKKVRKDNGIPTMKAAVAEKIKEAKRANPDASDRQIAADAGVSAGTIKKARAEKQEIPENPQPKPDKHPAASLLSAIARFDVAVLYGHDVAVLVAALKKMIADVEKVKTDEEVEAAIEAVNKPVEPAKPAPAPKAAKPAKPAPKPKAAKAAKPEPDGPADTKSLPLPLDVEPATENAEVQQ